MQLKGGLRPVGIHCYRLLTQLLYRVTFRCFYLPEIRLEEAQL